MIIYIKKIFGTSNLLCQFFFKIYFLPMFFLCLTNVKLCFHPCYSLYKPRIKIWKKEILKKEQEYEMITVIRRRNTYMLMNTHVRCISSSKICNWVFLFLSSFKGQLFKMNNTKCGLFTEIKKLKHRDWHYEIIIFYSVQHISWTLTLKCLKPFFWCEILRK